MDENKFKVGDIVRIWDKYEEDRSVSYMSYMSTHAGQIATIAEGSVKYDAAIYHRLDIDNGRWWWSEKILSPENDDAILPEISMEDLEAILNG